MAVISNVVKTMIQGRIGTLNRSSGYEYRDFWYKDANGKNIHVVGWHKALDITTLGTVVAFERGKVLSVVKGIAGQTTNPSGGNSVLLEHGNGDRTLYCHLDNGSNNHLSVGQIVEAGTKLGTDVIKTTGNSTGLHLHFGIYIKSQGDYADPTPYLQGNKVLTPYVGTIPKPTPSDNFNVGDKVVINGSLYVSSTASNPVGSVNNKITIITRKATGTANPYNTTGDLGWMKEDCISKYNESTFEPQKEDLLIVVKKTIRGDYGNMPGRKSKIEATGNTYSEVKRQVNLNLNAGLTRWDNIKLF